MFIIVMAISLLTAKKISLNNLKNGQKIKDPMGLFNFGWGTWDRTKECRSQRPMPYRLAIPQLFGKTDFNDTWNFFLKNNFH